jgi:hypothetical protein
MSKERFGVNVGEGRCYCFRCEKRISIPSFLKSLGLSPGSFLASAGVDGREPALSRLSARKGKEDPLPVSFDNYQRIGVHGEDSGPTEDIIREYLQGRGIDLDLWEVGMSDDDDLAGRAIFLFRENTIPVYFQARDVTGRSYIKTVNPPSGTGWPRSEVFFGFDLLQDGMSVAIGEGPFDGCALTDIENGILGTCLLGKTITKWQIALLKRFTCASTRMPN